jgi:CHAD domain-containing protein
MVEALAPLFRGVSARQFQAMKEYQSMMGDIQDNEVLMASFAEFQRKGKISPDSAVRFEEELLRRRRWLIGAYLQDADQLREFWPSSQRPRKAARQATRRKAA